MRKRVILFAIAVFVSSKMFAGIVLKQSVQGFAWNNETDKYSKNEDKNSSFNCFVFLPVFSGDFSCLYEFNPKEDFYIDAGLSFGLGVMAIYYSLDFGTAFQITENDKHIVDLNISLQPGAYQVLLDRDVPFYFIKANVDFDIMKKNRKGFFYSPGLFDYMYFDNMDSGDNGKHWLSINNLGLQFTVGWRF